LQFILQFLYITESWQPNVVCSHNTQPISSLSSLLVTKASGESSKLCVSSCQQHLVCSSLGFLKPL
jgi:hypothetical protein